jgi:hypothetical protein
MVALHCSPLTNRAILGGLVSTRFRMRSPLTHLVLYGRRIGSDLWKNKIWLSFSRLPQRSATICTVCVYTLFKLYPLGRFCCIRRAFGRCPSHCGRAGCASHVGPPKLAYNNCRLSPHNSRNLSLGRVLAFLLHRSLGVSSFQYTCVSSALDFPQTGFCFTLAPEWVWGVGGEASWHSLSFMLYVGSVFVLNFSQIKYCFVLAPNGSAGLGGETTSHVAKAGIY